MARGRVFQIRLNDKEWERLHRESERREMPVSQLFREFLKQLDKEPQTS